MGDAGADGKTAVTELPIAELLSAPLEAAVDAQFRLARSTVDFITSVGFDKDQNNNDVARNLAFTLQGPAGTDGKPAGMSVQVPLLALVAVPNLAIEELNVDFQMEVTSTDKVSEKNGQSGTDGGRISVSGKVSSNAEHTRETNQSAKYQIQMKARKQTAPEGLSRVLDILAATVRGYDNTEQ